MGGRSSSSNSTRNAAYDNRVLHQDKNDNSVRNDFDYDIDNSVRNDYEIDNSVETDLGDGAILSHGDVTLNALDGGAIGEAFDFAENVAEGSLTASSEALSKAFSSTAGGVIEAGKDFVKVGGLVLAAIALLMFLNKDK